MQIYWFNKQKSIAKDRSLREDAKIPETGEWIRTPRGTFHVTSLKKDELEKQGYGYHHSSDDGKYAVYGNGTDAYAVKNESLKEDTEKTVIYKKLGTFYTTPESNFNNRVQNSRRIQKLDDFESVDEIKDYFKKYFGSTDDDFIVDKSALDEDTKKISSCFNL